MRLHMLGLATGLALTVSHASAAVRITEYMYNGSGTGSIGEFVEFTNLGPAPVDFTGWSFDDSSQVPGSTSLSDFGTVAVGESVILTDETAVNFTANWGLSGVKVIGSNGNNLGRGDEINLYDASNALVDRLTYSDQTYPGTIRTNAVSGWAYVTGSGPFGIIDSSWKLSVAGDAQSSVASSLNELGSPGRYTAAPEPTALLAMGFGALMLRRRA
ncbi:MAG: lamin tail domain-containing protein [Tepidisphaeraceae bacterium]